MKKVLITVLSAVLLTSSACSISKNESTSSVSTAEKAEETEDTITFTQEIVTDNEQCSIILTEITEDDLWGLTIKAVLENRSSDKTYMFAIDSASVNGVQTDPMFAVEIPAGMQSVQEISFMDEDLEENGIEKFTDIVLNFRVYDIDDLQAEDVANETVHIYPYGEENAETFTRKTLDTDNVLADNDSVSVIVTGYEEDDILGYTVKMYLVNKTEKNLMYTVENASINGIMLDPYYAQSVNGGNCAFGEMYWLDTTLEENGITDAETIRFTLRIYDTDETGEDIVNEEITLNP